MTTLRTFIAIDLSDEARTVLADLQKRFKAVAPPNTVRWPAPETIHLTLHFLGDVTAADIGKIEQAIEAAAATCSPFSLVLGDFGYFPNMRRPRILWVGTQGDSRSLQELHRLLGQKLTEAIGFKPDSRPYSPHLTIGRVKNNLSAQQLAQLSQALSQEQVIGRLADLPVTEICLIKSELKSTGPIYTKLHSGALKSSS